MDLDGGDLGVGHGLVAPAEIFSENRGALKRSTLVKSIVWFLVTKMLIFGLMSRRESKDL